MQLNQAGSCTERRGETNGIGCVAHRRVVHCCFFMFVKKLSQFVLAPDAFFNRRKGAYAYNKSIIEAHYCTPHTSVKEILHEL